MDIEKIRAQLRAEAGHQSRSSSMTNPAVMMVLICAVLLGILYYPFFQHEVAVPLQPSAAIPTFRPVAPGNGTIRTPSAAQRGGEAQVPGATQNVVNYAGLSPREMGKVADAACLARAHARYPHWSKTPRLTTPTLDEIFLDDMPHFNELLHCLLTEAVGRYCSSSQRSMITAEIAMYFRVLEHGNKGLAQLRADLVSGPGPGRVKREFPLDPAELRRINKLEFVPDHRVIAAIEARISDGTLTTSDRKTFGAAAPAAMRQIFAHVKLSKPACPEQPWWAFWRGL